MSDALSKTYALSLTKDDINTKLKALFPSEASFGLSVVLAPFLKLLKNNVKLEFIQYVTKGPNGKLATASGFIAYPVDSSGNVLKDSIKSVSYQHGTLLREIAWDDMQFQVLAPIVASSGYLAIVPFYLGFMYDSYQSHPYIIKDSYGQNGIDFIKAAQSYYAGLGGKTDSDMRLFGYSEGGYATMALHEAIDNSDDLTTSVSIPMAGPYALSSVMYDVMMTEKPYPRSYYLPYLMSAYQDKYAVFGADATFDDIIAPADLPYVKAVFNSPRVLSSDLADNLLNEVPLHILNADLQTALKTNHATAGGCEQKCSDNSVLCDGANKLCGYLKDNDLPGTWTPKGEVNFIQCMGDDFIKFTNTCAAWSDMKTLLGDAGSKNITVTGLPCASHEIGALVALITGFSYIALKDGNSVASDRTALIFNNLYDYMLTIGDVIFPAEGSLTTDSVTMKIGSDMLVSSSQTGQTACDYSNQYYACLDDSSVKTVADCNAKHPRPKS